MINDIKDSPEYDQMHDALNDFGFESKDGQPTASNAHTLVISSGSGVLKKSLSIKFLVFLNSSKFLYFLYFIFSKFFQ